MDPRGPWSSNSALQWELELCCICGHRLAGVFTPTKMYVVLIKYPSPLHTPPPYAGTER